MLMLEYKEGQAIQIGDITVTVLQDSSGKLRLEIDAPSDVPVYMKEPERRRGGMIGAYDYCYG